MRDHESARHAQPQMVAYRYKVNNQAGLFGPPGKKYEATLEAWVCATCGLVEWYCNALDVLKSMVDGGDVRFVDGNSTSNDGPFR